MLKILLKKVISSFMAVLLMLALITTASADRVYTGEGFVIPASRIGGVRPNLQEPDETAAPLLEQTPEPDEEIEAGTQKTPEALDANVEGLVVVDGKEKTEDTNITEQTEVWTNNAGDNPDIENVEILDEITEPDDIDQQIEITATQENESEQLETTAENEVIYLEDDEGNLVLNENGDPVTYIQASEEMDTLEQVITYVRDEDGNLIMDVTGDPIPIVPKGYEIPVRYQRDESGKLVLDDKGNPIPTQTIAAGSQKSIDILDELDPNRSISIYFNYFGNTSVKFGEEFQIIAVAKGYDNVSYSFQWQYSLDGENWVDVEGETASTMNVLLTPMNFRNWWRVGILIDDIQ